MKGARKAGFRVMSCFTAEILHKYIEESITGKKDRKKQGKERYISFSGDCQAK